MYDSSLVNSGEPFSHYKVSCIFLLCMRSLVLLSSTVLVEVVGRAVNRENELGIQVISSDWGFPSVVKGCERSILINLCARFMNGEYVLAGADLGRDPACL